MTASTLPNTRADLRALPPELAARPEIPTRPRGGSREHTGRRAHGRIVIVAALIAAAIIAFTARPAAAATPFRIVMVGDSIGTTAFPHVTGPALHWDTEPSRSPYDTGAENRASTVQALGVLSRTVANSSQNWIVVQEGGTGTIDGRYITNSEWTAFVWDVLRLTAGKCLLFVYPGYGHTVNGVAHEAHNDIAYARTIMARDIFQANTHRCIYTVNWWYAADQNAHYLQADGLHPTSAGALWLANAINAILPNA